MKAMNKDDKKTIYSAFMALSVACTIFAIVGTMWQDLYLASTQWILLAVLSAVWGLFFKLEMKA